jgi:hypothetical protein
VAQSVKMSPVTSSTPAADAAAELANQAIALGTTHDRNSAATELLRLARDNASSLETARGVLVRRLQIRSDDHAATAGLTVINAAIALAGWADPVAWKPRKWFLPRRFSKR